MDKFRHIGLLFFLAWAFNIGSFSQERTVISGLGSDSLYLALLDRERLLQSREDSLNLRVSQTRSLFRTDPDNRETYAADILRLEGELFDVRSQLG
ncbi:MAG: hypothetical protein LIO77_02355, partial [Rikenellaceae bacterium]|nr:hypothetical protein [Rikenellaceae bacterium]